MSLPRQHEVSYYCKEIQYVSHFYSRLPISVYNSIFQHFTQNAVQSIALRLLNRLTVFYCVILTEKSYSGTLH